MCLFAQSEAKDIVVPGEICLTLLFFVAVRCKYSQRVTADVHHQLQRRIPVFGCLASRTALVVHFCLCNAEEKA